MDVSVPGVAVFDLDGTLIDTAPDLASSLNHCLAAADMPPLALEVVRPHAGHGARAMLREAYGRAGRVLPDAEMDAQVARFLDHYADNLAELSRPFPGAVTAMDRLAAAGYRLAICTNKYERFARALLGALDLDQRFAAVCGADTFPRRKPDPMHLLGTIGRAGGDPEALLHDRRYGHRHRGRERGGHAFHPRRFRLCAGRCGPRRSRNGDRRICRTRRAVARPAVREAPERIATCDPADSRTSGADVIGQKRTL